jgi:hypothetical protein
MADRTRLNAWRVAVTGALATALVVGPLVSDAGAATGKTYGGPTSQGLPIVLELNAKSREIVRAMVVLDLTCTSGATGLVSDTFIGVTVKRSGRFGVQFGPVTQRNDDGTTTDFSGSLSGRLNPAKTKITGVWRYTYTDHDAAGAVTDTCGSGSVRWTAKD